MVDITQLRNKINAKVFDNLGSTAVLSSVTTTSLDKWGDASNTSPTGTSVTFVPWNIMKPNQTFESFGDLQEGDFDAAFKYDQTLAINYTLTFDSNTYTVKAIEEFWLKDGILVKVARLRKSL